MKIQNLGSVSKEYLKHGIATFTEAIEWTHKLPFGENWDPTDYMLIFKELCGTSATKHAALAALALEHRQKEIYLKLGFSKNKAHLFLHTKEQLLDITYPENSGVFNESLVEEHALLPSEIGERQEMLYKLYLNRSTN